MSDFRDLFHEAVDHVTPSDRLDDIRTRVSEEATMSRRIWLAPLAGAAAVALVVGGFMLASDGDPSGTPEPPAASSPGGTASPSPSDSPSPSPTEPAQETRAVPVYFVGDTPYGPRLYREFHRVTEGRQFDAVGLATGGAALDPDYRSAWPAGTVLDVSFDGVGEDGQFGITLRDASLRDRPQGMSRREAELAVEQIVYTVQGAAQTRAPVQFYYDHNPIDQVLGVPTSEPLTNGNPVEVLSLVNISSPGEGTTVTADTLTVTGVANSFEATVPLRLLRSGQAVWQGYATAEGCCEEKLFPFETTVDISDLAPGTYVLEASTDDPSGGAEGNGPYVDTRTITVR